MQLTIMELRRAADALLRAEASCASFLAPSNLIRRSLRVQCQITSRRNPDLPRRSFTTSNCKYDSQRPPATTGSPQSNSPSELPLDGPKPTSNELAKRLWADRSTRPAPIVPQRGNSATAMFANLHGSTGIKSTGINLDDMLSVAAAPRETSSQNALLGYIDNTNFGLTAGPLLPKPPPMRLNPSTGRTFTVGGHVDVARAFQLLNQSCAANDVRNDERYQRFHERGGLKRKRLRRERWRKRFGEGFKAAVFRVKQLRTQGW
ncbi:hypothetical protein HYFRA_00002582 [Hymenoscyphus fraxineus]|uniref:Uncharacterized protein n=1 Tax=Hymenoscyphus fraxineus TaxID=746836 RepID=A0A9N9Q0S5_9HELO|nr:hypothetical protein HYFRA_00002582 [Hymenoscyphus fraxineus]